MRWDRNEAENLTQQAFVRQLGSPDPQGIENIEAFAFRTATNLLRDRSCASMRRPDAETPDAESNVPAALGEEIPPERVLVIGTQRRGARDLPLEAISDNSTMPAKGVINGGNT